MRKKSKLYKQWLYKCYKVYEGKIENTEQIEYRENRNTIFPEE